MEVDQQMPVRLFGINQRDLLSVELTGRHTGCSGLVHEVLEVFVAPTVIHEVDIAGVALGAAFGASPAGEVEQGGLTIDGGNVVLVEL